MTPAHRSLLEQLEEGLAGAEVDVALAYLALEDVVIDAGELRPAVRRALLLLASGGDPRRAVEPGGRAVSALAADLDTPAGREQLAAALQRLQAQAGGLPRVAAALERLLADSDLAWHVTACALLAAELDEDGD